MSFSKVFSFILFILMVIVELFPMAVKIHNVTLYLFVAWIISSYLAFPTVIKQAIATKRYLCLFAFLLFCFLSSSIGKGFFQGFIFTLFMMRVVSPVLMYDIVRTCNLKTQRVIVFFLLVLFLVYAFWMFQLINKFGAELGIKGSVMSADSEEHVSTAFGFVYSLPILVVMLLLMVRSILKQVKETGVGWIKVAVGLLLIVYFSVLVFKSLFMTAIVLIITGVCLGLFYKNTGKGWIIKSMVAFLVLIIVFITQYDKLSSNVSRLGSNSTDQRIEELYMLFTGNSGQAADMGARQNLTMISIETFLKHPILGANYFIGNNRYNNEVIGNHSEWFDMLALYGIFVFFLYYVIYKTLKTQYRDTGVLLPSLIYFLTGFLNPMFYFVVNLTIFVIVPLLNSYNPQEETA